MPKAAEKIPILILQMLYSFTPQATLALEAYGSDKLNDKKLPWKGSYPEGKLP